MSREQLPTIEKERKRISIEEIKNFLEQKRDFYLENGIRDVSPLIKELEEKKYENSLRFFERILGQPTEIVSRGDLLDLISEKRYHQGEYEKHSRTIEKRPYQEKKEYLREIVQKLTEERYKDRENFDHLTGREKYEILHQMANSVDYGGEKFKEIEKKFKRNDYSDLFDYLDFKITKALKEVERLEKKKDKKGINYNLELLEKLRRTRLFFRKHV